MSRYLPPDRDPLTASILVGDGAEDGVPIVGVIHDVIERAVDREPEPSLYLSLSHNVTWTRSLVGRTSEEPSSVVPAIQDAIWSVDAGLPLYNVETMEALA